MAGFFFIDRDLLLHEMWLEKPFSRGQAWVDLIGLANYAGGYIRVAGEKIRIERGQCGWSEVKLSDRWGWSRDKTRRFLDGLVDAQRILKKPYNRTTVITICNYEEYQGSENSNNTAEKHQTIQQTIHQKNTIEEEEEEVRRRIKDNPLPPTGGRERDPVLLDVEKSTKPDRFEEFYEAYPKKQGRKAAQKAYRTAKARGSEAAIIAAAAHYAAERRADTRPGSKQFTKHPSTWLNDDCWLDYEDIETTDETTLSPDRRLERMLAEIGLE